jgi:hypothetical protein
MRSFFLSIILAAPLANAFSLVGPSGVLCGHGSRANSVLFASKGEESSEMRRQVIGGVIFSAASMLCGAAANAIPMVSVDEFSILLRDSSMSIRVVEFSGPKSETVIVKLVDGTTFGIKDIVESSTDPRSPLKLSAACRESTVKTKFVDIESLLASTSPNKKKVYANERVQLAAEKERAKAERMRVDEEERLEQVRKMEL